MTMKTYTLIFAILSIFCLFAGLFGTTPNGEPATHQLVLSILTGILALAFNHERRKAL